MKPEIHPEYLPVTVTCSCGKTYDTYSTRSAFTVEICANCHPLYTGKQKVLDSAGRIERFTKKYAQAKAANATKAATQAAAKAAKSKAAPEIPKE